MNTKTALGIVSVVVIAVGIGVAMGLTLGGGPADSPESGETTPQSMATPTATPTPSPTPTTVSSPTTPRSTPTLTPTPTPDGPVSRSKIEYRLYQRVNFHRTSHGYDRLQLNESLRAVARSHSEDMAAEGFVGHKGSDGATLPDRLERFGADCRASTETVGRTPFDRPVDAENGTTIRYDTAGEVANALVREWMNGDGTRHKILRIEWIDVGIGVHVVERTEGAMVYATQVLCEP
jgi:uncharacterized protein YkwD